MTVLRTLLFAHAFITFAAGVVLVVVPGAIPATIGVTVTSGAFVLCYFLAGAEFSLAFLSYLGARSNNVEAIRSIVQGIIVLHASTAALEMYAISRGISPALWANVALRIIVVAIFSLYGFKERSPGR